MADSAPEPEMSRSRRLERGLDDVLPNDTADDRVDAVDFLESDSGDHDRWLRDNRPPHHDIPW